MIAGRVVAAIAVDGLTVNELATLLAPLLTSWPSATFHTVGSGPQAALVVVLPDPDGPGRGGHPIDRDAFAQAADELLDRLEANAADIGPSGGTSVLSAAPLANLKQLGNQGVSSSAAERRRRTWRESKARARAKARTTSTPTLSTTSTTSTDVHTPGVDMSTGCGHRQVTAGVDSVDVHLPPRTPLTVGCKNNNGAGAREARATRPRLPGLDGPMTEEHRTRPDDLLRRRLATAVPAVLARAALDAALARGTDIRSPDAYVAATAKRIAVAQAPGIRDAVETALARWGTATTPTHVAELLATTRPQAANSGNHEAGPRRDELTAARQLATTWARAGLTPAETAEGLRTKFPTLTPAQIAEATAA